MRENITAQNSWDAKANAMLWKKKTHELQISDLAEWYGMFESEVRELFFMRDSAADYLRSRGKENHWSLVSDKEDAFRQIVKRRASLATVGEKHLFEAMVFALIDDRDGGCLYEAISDAHKHFYSIKAALLEEFPVAPSGYGEGLDILGGGPVVAVDIPLVLEIEKREETRKTAAGIVKNVISMTKLIGKDNKSADFPLIQLQKANTLIQSAIAAGQRPKSREEGVEKQLLAIEQGIASIRKWLATNP